jgi:hypothetical protein
MRSRNSRTAWNSASHCPTRAWTPCSAGTYYAKYVIEDETRLRRSFYPGACPRGHVRQNREINALFTGLELIGSVLLKSGVREVLFRKPI